MNRDLPTSGDPRPGPGELARRLRAYMGYADRTLDEDVNALLRLEGGGKGLLTASPLG